VANGSGGGGGCLQETLAQQGFPASPPARGPRLPGRLAEPQKLCLLGPPALDPAAATPSRRQPRAEKPVLGCPHTLLTSVFY